MIRMAGLRPQSSAMILHQGYRISGSFGGCRADPDQRAHHTYVVEKASATSGDVASKRNTRLPARPINDCHDEKANGISKTVRHGDRCHEAAGLLATPFRVRRVEADKDVGPCRSLPRRPVAARLIEASTSRHTHTRDK